MLNSGIRDGDRVPEDTRLPEFVLGFQIRESGHGIADGRRAEFVPDSALGSEIHESDRVPEALVSEDGAQFDNDNMKQDNDTFFGYVKMAQ